MFYVYYFDLSDRMWFASLVLRIYPHTKWSSGSSHLLFQGYPHNMSYPSFSSSNRVSRSHAFTPQTHTENILSGIFGVRGSSSTSRIRVVRHELDCVRSDGFGSSFFPSLHGCVLSTILVGPPCITFFFVICLSSTGCVLICKALLSAFQCIIVQA
jgi:hypothetical protein